MIRIDGVQSSEVPILWPSVLEFLYNVVNHSEDLDLATVRKRLLFKELQLWLVTKNREQLGVFVTEIKPPALMLAMLGGKDVQEWLPDVIDVANRFGGEHGCNYIEVIGRPGWRKFQKQMGFRHTYSVFRKEITNGQAEHPIARHANQ